MRHLPYFLPLAESAEELPSRSSQGRESVPGARLVLPPDGGLIHSWLEPVFAATIEVSGRADHAFALFGIDGALVLASVTIGVIGLLVAWRLFGVDLGRVRITPQPERVRAISASNAVTRFLYRASLNKWWFDDLNHLLFMVIGGRVAAACWWFDRTVVDGTVNGIGAAVSDTGRGLRRIQTGRVQNYALGIAIGLLVMAGSYLLIAGR